MLLVSVCLPLMPSCKTYCLTWFFLPWNGVSLHGYSSKAQPLLLTVDEVYLLTDNTPDLERAVDPLIPSVPMQPPLQGRVVSVLIIPQKD